MKKIGLVLVGILLVLVFWQFDFLSFINSMSQVSLLAFILLLILQIISQLLVNYQWCRIARNIGGEYNFFKMLYVNSRGSIIDSITPGVKVGGELTRAVLLKNELNYSTQEAATLVSIQKMVSFSSFFTLNLFAFAHLSGEIEIFQNIVLKIVVYSFLIVIITSLIAMFAWTSFLENKIIKLVPKSKWTSVLHRYMLTLLANIKALKGIKGEMYKQFLLSLSIWVLFPLKMILLVNLFTANYDWIFLSEVTYISYMMGMIPILPGGFGSFEGTMTSLLILMELNSSEALAITILFRFITFWFVILLSLLYAFIWKMGGMKSGICKTKAST